MESFFYLAFIEKNRSPISTIEKYFALLDTIRLILHIKAKLKHGFQTEYTSLSAIDDSIMRFDCSWSKFPRLGIPEDRYMNIIEKILEYTQMIIDQKGVDYQTLPGMKEFVELVDQQFEEIVSKDPKLDALRKDPYGL